ncbi:hypothetical protein KBC86_00120 [Candidatus Gracilibacteria bacterium]|nr:hypothetical protein [Candidatus Gracilibacteria bacterium]
MSLDGDLERMDNDLLVFCHQMVHKYEKLSHLRGALVKPFQLIDEVQQFLLLEAHKEIGDQAQPATSEYYHLLSLQEQKSRTVSARTSTVGRVSGTLEW